MITPTSFDTNSPEEEEDEVVYETNVFLSKTLCGKLTLFHYPTKSCSMISEDQKILSSKIKPKQGKLEIEVGLNVHSDNYDRSKGEMMAYNVDGQGPQDESYFKSPLMDKYVLLGNNSTSAAETYAIGLMRKGELHITPVHSVIEINPEFTHMDKMDVASKKAQNLEEEEIEEEAVAVTVRFEGSNANKDRALREKSFHFQQQKNGSEPWMDCTFHKIGSNMSACEYEKLMCSQLYIDACSEGAVPQEYLKDLVPESLRLTGYETAETEETVILRNSPLSDQITNLFINAQLLTFSMLMEKLPPDVDRQCVERLIQTVAVLIQGCWAVKSDLLYKPDTISLYTGVESETLRNARDYILFLFTKSRFITRKEVLLAIRVPDEDFRDIISQLADKTGRGWEFKFPYDKDFIENHPVIAQSQEIKWNLVYKKILKSLGMCEFEGDSSKNSRPRQKRPSRSSMSEGDESDAAPSSSKNRVPPTGKKRSAPSPSKSAFQMGTLDVSPTFLETTPPEALRAELRDLAGDAVRQQFCLTLSEIRELIQESHLSSLLERSDFESLLERALEEYGVQKLKNKWPQNTTPESLYAYCKFGNKLDRFRTALLDLFSTTARTRNNLFVKKVEDELRERISDNDCRQIFEEYCIYKSGFYYLKGTIAPDT